jgi:hypothetical protein
MISSEPPPLDSGDEEEETADYIEFRSAGLKLDILGGKPNIITRVSIYNAQISKANST